jgi:hypothetical protein
MALTRTSAALTQLTASGDTSDVDVSAAYTALFSIKHVNGTGTITVAATIQPKISHNGTDFFNYGGAFTCSTTASATEIFTLSLDLSEVPDAEVRFTYVEPTGSTGETLDVSYTLTTGV